jgi:hypothetical protein
VILSAGPALIVRLALNLVSDVVPELAWWSMLGMTLV